MTAGGASTAWTWRHAIIKSDLPATTRHVLLTVSMHMNELGEGCYPTIEMLVKETGLSKRSVLTHLQAGIDAGWLVRLELGLRGRKWRRCEYRSRWPDRGEAIVDDDPDDQPIGEEAKRADRDAPRGDEARRADGETERRGEGGSPHEDDDVVNDVHHVAGQGGEPLSNEVVNVLHHYRKTSRDLSIREREGALARSIDRNGQGTRSATAGQRSDTSTDGRTVLDMIALYPHGRQYPRAQVEAAWAALTPDERQRAIDELPGWLDERKAAKLGRMFLQTYLAERQFDLPKSAETRSKPGRGGKTEKGRNGVTFIGENPSFRHWSAAWFAHLIWRVTNGKSIGLALQQARANPASGWGCPRAELPDLTVLDHVVHVSSRSEEWRAWRKWFEERDPTAHWPSFDREMWFDLPSHCPPGSELGRSEGQGAPNENPDEFPVEARI